MILDSVRPGYPHMAEFHDLFMGEPWDRLVAAMEDAFGQLSEEAIIADFGAGSGLGTRQLASATRAQIIAVEPDLVMRSILLARVADAPALAERVSVLAGSVPSDLHLLPSRIDGFACMHMLGHLTPLQRLDLFTWIEAHLAPEGRGVVTVPKEAPEASNETDVVVETRRIGIHEYRAIHRADPRPDTYSSRYEVWNGDVLIRAAEFDGSWRPVSLAELRRELADVGLRLDEIRPGVAAVTKRDRA